MANIIDGVMVYGEMAYFEDWLEAMGHGSSAEILERCVMHYGAEGEQAYNITIDGLYDEFCDWAESYDLEPIPC